TAALHDLDANKPGGSIKIRVKTYAHSLRLQAERLEDLSQKRRSLELSIERKRLELLELKRAQSERARGSADPGVLQQIELVRSRVREYEARLAPAPEPIESGIVSLGRKTEDGRIVPVQSGSGHVAHAPTRAPTSIPAE